MFLIKMRVSYHGMSAVCVRVGVCLCVSGPVLPWSDIVSLPLAMQM